MADWHTPESVRAFWKDAPPDDVVLETYLATAKAAVLAYAPALPEDAVGVPDSYPLAQYLQARNIWNSGKASPNGGFDGSEYGISAYPLDWQVKQILRPQRGLGAIA
jgi:hypothetical protein